MEMKKIIDSASKLGKQGVSAAQAGLESVKSAVDSLPEAARRLPDQLKQKAPAKVMILEDMSDELKRCYLSVLVWFVYFHDRQIDERELCEIQVLMTQLRCSGDVRQDIRAHLEAPEDLDPRVQIARMLQLQDSDSSEAQLALKCSLMKDAIRILRATSIKSARDNEAVNHLAGVLGLDDSQVRLLEEACAQDEKILAGELSDAKIIKGVKALSAKAAGVGVPVTAIYLSGSVVGLSAAGITSGLAALGLGGILGLSSMVTGIGVVIIGGLALYKTTQWLLGVKKRERFSRRELMLQEVLRIHQRAIINLGDDLAYFGQRIAALTTQMDKTDLEIQHLYHEVLLLTKSAGAMSRLGEKANGFERDLQEELDGQGSK